MWQPTANLVTLKKRAQLLADIRAFFAQRNLLEVDVPVLGASTVTDPHLQAISADVNGQTLFLQTSPEFYMKRLLAAGSGSCYYLGKAFRSDERGRRHRSEFTMLEWYHTGYDDRQLRAEVIHLIQSLAGAIAVRECSYAELFEQYLNINPHTVKVDELSQLARTRLDVQWTDPNRSVWLDLLFSHCIEPHLMDLVLVYDYPACQCALARLGLDKQGHQVAKRFEVFWRGMELGNGYWELQDGREQAARFAADNAQRQAAGLPAVEPDQQLLAALAAGLPECAGIAMGVDRLLMCLCDADAIDKVVPF